MNIVVVGGGSAGWISALYAKKIFPHYNITLIESKQIGILGAGEASTPHLIDMLDFLDIPMSELIKNANATIKMSAKFTGWSKNLGDYFHHPFIYHDDLVSEKYGYIDNENTGTNVYHLYAYLNNIPMKDYCFFDKLCENNLVPFVKINNDHNVNPIINYERIGDWSLNFDARLLAEYFEKIGILRNINKIEKIVKQINTNQDQEIISLVFDDNQEIECDFVFDCTGFARLIIGKFYKSEWISYKQYLPTNKALPFFLDIDRGKDIPPYIEAIAMDYGWMWKTPLQNRYGCGYVFDSDHISTDRAKEEVEKKLGFEVFPPKIFDFEPGVYKQVWIKNCLAVGLSSGFVEPLEATSLMQAMFTLSNFFSNKNNIFTKNEKIKKNFNFVNEKDSFAIVEYLYWHFTTNKENTVFWKYFTKNNKMPAFIENILTINKERVLSKKDFVRENLLFNTEDYISVLFGHKMFDEKNMDKYKNYVINFENRYFDLVRAQNMIKNNFSNHLDFLEHLKQ